tara:strand:+ start:1675 stop:1857 length:183 start_codon:yes stop_codon:yes gene_type:complete
MLSGYDQWKLSYPPQWDKESDLLECQECGTPIDPAEYDMEIDEMEPMCIDCTQQEDEQIL